MDCEDKPCLKREAQPGSRLIVTDQFKALFHSSMFNLRFILYLWRLERRTGETSIRTIH